MLNNDSHLLLFFQLDAIYIYITVQALRKVWEIEARELSVGEVLGRGGFGLVVSGYWNDTPVAIKQLLPGIKHIYSTALEDFSAELMLLRSVRHPNIVTLFGGGTMSDGSLFLVRL